MKTSSTPVRVGNNSKLTRFTFSTYLSNNLSNHSNTSASITITPFLDDFCNDISQIWIASRPIRTFRPSEAKIAYPFLFQWEKHNIKPDRITRLFILKCFHYNKTSQVNKNLLALTLILSIFLPQVNWKNKYSYKSPVRIWNSENPFFSLLSSRR